jgi:hypothetical protein
MIALSHLIFMPAVEEGSFVAHFRLTVMVTRGDGMLRRG